MISSLRFFADADEVKQDLSNPGTPCLPGILPSPVHPSRSMLAMHQYDGNLQQSEDQTEAQDDSSYIQIGLTVAADDPRRFSRSVLQLTQPSEAAWLAQTYGGTPKDYQNNFEERVNKVNNSQHVSGTTSKPLNEPAGTTSKSQNELVRRPSVRKVVAKRVTSMFNRNGRNGGGRSEQAVNSLNNREGVRGHPPGYPLSFGGAEDESDGFSTQCIPDIAIERTTASPHSTDGSADEIDDPRNLCSLDLNRALPPLRPTAFRPVMSTVRSNTPSLTYSGPSTAHHSTESTVPSSTNHSTTSSKHDFRNITRALITPATSKPLSELQRTSNRLDPEKFSPASTSDFREMGDA